MDLFRKKSITNIVRDFEAGQLADSEGFGALKRALGVRDLTALGIAAIIGAGIFSTIGNASADGGPGIIFLFLFTAIACSFAAFAYAEFASLVPVSGSAYTYSYVAFGELVAWIMGWALIMEYAIGNITVAISWSAYFTGMLESGGIHLPHWMTMDYLSAATGFKQADLLMHGGKSFANLGSALQTAYTAWTTSPKIGPLHIVANLPALMIIIFITWLVYIGIKESKNANNLMVAIKLIIVVMVIIVGAFFVNTKNWHPFMPNGIGGVLKGVSAVFFAYIGFDAISTTAEECKNPQRDLPRGMMYSIIICTVLYVAIALVLTGMVKYNELGVGDPLAFVFQKLHMGWMSGIIGVSAIVAMASVLLVFQLGQPRIWMSMSRDGLLPKKFSTIHPKYRTPSFATIVTGFVVAVPSLFMNLTMVTDLCSIGTLFAFVLVCGGVLRLETLPGVPKGKFRTPYINSKYVLPPLLLVAIAVCFIGYRQDTMNFIQNTPAMYKTDDFIGRLGEKDVSLVCSRISIFDPAGFEKANSDLETYLSSLDKTHYATAINSFSLPLDKKYESGFSLFRYKIPVWIFIIIALVLAWFSIRKNLSLIPLLGLLCCLYMMSQMGVTNWMGFSIWLVVGLSIYFTYSCRNSKLNPARGKAAS
jgi:amino acid transporter